MTVFPTTATFPVNALAAKLRAYWSLVKCLQTGLLVITGMAGYVSARPPLAWGNLIALAASLFLAISGSTMLNMLYDADIDARMRRTVRRPLPMQRVGRGETLVLGLACAALGVGWAVAVAPLYGAVVLAGLFFDSMVYTVWLKRRTPWSIVWGGIAGGMPVLAGRVLGVGALDVTGFALALAVLFWIPTHMLTFSLKNADDYCLAGVPVFPNTHGAAATRRTIALSTVAAVLVMFLSAAQVSLGLVPLALLGMLGGTLVAVALCSLRMARRSTRLDALLYKLASLYMLGSMLLIITGV